MTEFEPPKTTHADYRIAFVLFVITYVISWVCPVQVINDPVYGVLLSETLITRGSFNLDYAFADGFGENHSGQMWGLDRPYQLETPDEDHIYYWYPPGAYMLAAPLISPFLAMGFSTLDDDGNHSIEREMAFHRFLGALLASAFAAASWLSSRLFLGRGGALIVVLAFTYGTSIIGVNSRGLWSESVGVLVMLAAIYLLVRDEWKNRQLWAAVVASLLAFLFYVRPTYAFVILPVTIYFLFKYRDLFLIYACVGAAWALIFAAWSYALHGHVLPSYYQLGNRMRLEFILPGLLGVLISPGRGLFVYSPFLLAVVFAGGPFAWFHERRALARLTVFVLVTYFLILSSWSLWWGGMSYGPRLTTGVLPWLLLLCLLGCQRVGEYSLVGYKLLLGGICLLGIPSVVLHFIGILSTKPYEWNDNPVYIDNDPGRIWSWGRPPFVAGWEDYWPLNSGGVLTESGIVDFASIGSEFPVHGWSLYEEDVRWTEGEEAVIAFTVEPEANPSRLVLELLPNVSQDGGEEFRFSIVLNKTTLLDTTLTGRFHRRIELEVPDEAWDSYNLLRLKTPDAASPKELGIGGDPRTLGVWVTRMRFEY